MKEFVEKLIGRLEEYKYSHLIERDSGQSEHCLGQEDYEMMDCILCVWDKSIAIVNQLAEEYNQTIDVAELVEKFGVKKVQSNDGWILCSERLPNMGEFDIKTLWVTMHRKGIDFYFTRRVCWNNYRKRWEWKNGKEMADVWEVIAWRYMDVPAPYQPKGE